MILFPKEIVLSTLRDFFSLDDYYHYSKDPWGFANTVDHTDLVLEAGLHDNATTRVFIGENWRQDGIFYPAILVKDGGGKSVPISINRETGKVQWQFRTFEDGYGNITALRTPQSFVFNGAWEGYLTIDIRTRSLRTRDELMALVAICFTQITFDSLHRAGLIVRPLSWGSPSEIDDRNDKIFVQTITLDIRSEWEVKKPIGNIIEIINFAVEFGRVDNLNSPIAQNLTINTQNSFLDIVNNL
jgi:hypothetical protein